MLPMLRTYCIVAAMACAVALGASAAPSTTGYPRMMQGPVVGPVTETSVVIWARLSGEWPFRVGYALDSSLTDLRWSDPVTPARSKDFIVTVSIAGLSPSTRYYYRVEVAGGADAYLGKDAIGTFKTAPAKGEPAKFAVAFGSCARPQRDPNQAIWQVVTGLEPDLFFWIGDNMYGDSLEPEILAEEYRRQRDVPGLQTINRNVPQLAVWDDHDYGLNDSDRTNPVRDLALDVFKQYWPNPAYGLPRAPGVFFTYAYGGVDFFFLDCRYYRDPNEDLDSPEKTFLGAKQLEWLQMGLAQSAAPFKIIISGSGWTAAKGPGGDSWSSFLHERDALFDYIRTKNIGGVVLVSGDTHTGELNAIPWSDKGGYDFYDLVSSPLAQNASTGWRERTPEVRLRPGFEKPNVGLITFDLTGTPTLTFNLYGEDGTPAWEPLVLTSDELRNGVQSYPAKKTAE